jgi:hypothetical protein
MGRLGLSLEDLLLKTVTDIEFLKENLKKITERDQDSYLQKIVFDMIQKKEKHLSKIIEWAKIYCKQEYDQLKESDSWKNII